ncbi:phosphoserine aminotransferase [Xylaria acuta]|nr:phosphoserine aminotransferase [Xylaria acuta]
MSRGRRGNSGVSIASQELTSHILAPAPALLPTDVLETAAQALLNYKNTGLGIAEYSHRFQHAADISNEAKADLGSYLDIPADYQVLFMQGGGSSIFNSTVYNVVGAWVASRKAEILKQLGTTKEEEADQGKLVGAWKSQAARPPGPEHVNVAADAQTINDGKFGNIPEESTWKPSKDAAFVYYCDNETIESPHTKDDGTGPIVVADMSSIILSRKLPVKNFSLVFFSAQKNLGSTRVTVFIIKKTLLPPTPPQPSPAPFILTYGTIAKNNSLYNTLSIFDVYVADQIRPAAKKPLRTEKVVLIYEALEAHPNVYRIMSVKLVRSRMNICFRITRNGETDKTEAEFLKQGIDISLTGLKGHRSVGGIRASNLRYPSPALRSWQRFYKNLLRYKMYPCSRGTITKMNETQKV